jgi:hypothetical protein
MVSGTLAADNAVVDAAAVLASARRARATANAAEAQLLVDAVTWAELHTVEEIEEAATWWTGTKTMGQDTGIPIAGDGCPLVAESAVVEFATAIGLPHQAGRRLLGEALELAHRLPRTWARVQAGSLPAWRGRRIAEATTDLSAEAAAWVDVQVAPYAHRVGPAQVQRLIDTAIAEYMPGYAAERREQAAEQRHVTVECDQISFAGTVRIDAEVDLPDALDLEDALRAGAAHQAALGSAEPLHVRRAKALGMIARGEQTLPLGATEAQSDGDTGTQEVPAPRLTKRPGREVVLYAHLPAEAIRTGDPDAVGEVTSHGFGLVTAAQLATWCGLPDTSKITVKPVIDLNTEHTSTGYRPSEALDEQVRLRDRNCVFPHCHRAATHADLDHTIPYDPDGPPEQTRTGNLAVLCRLHHRMKTHCDWTYTMVEPGVFLWRSPYGYRYLRDRTGTSHLTPDPVEPPEQ